MIPAFVVRLVRRHFPLFLAILFLTPALILLGVFIYSRLNKPPAYAAPFTGQVKVSRQTTTLSTNGGWYTSLAHSGDGINGDAETGTFNPIHPGGTTESGAGSLAIGYGVAGATTYGTAEFIGFTPSASGNLAGVLLVFENLTSTALANMDLVVELLRFPSASCGVSSCTNYVTGSLDNYTYPADTVVERRTVWQFNQALSNENLAPGQFGRATLDFRFDPPLAVTAGSHYGIRIINMGIGTPVFGIWGQSPQLNGFPIINGTLRTIGVMDIDNANAPTINMPLALSGNNVIILGTSPTQSSGMVAANSTAGVGMPTVRRTENEHWTATYSSADGNWTIRGSVSGTQTRKLTTVTTGGTGPSWVNDGVPMTTLTANSTATTRLCVASIAGFAVNQAINLWDSDTATVALTVASTNQSDAACPGSGPSIITTTATVVGYTTSKNATVAQATWKQRIIQGAEQAFSQNMPSTTKICVANASQFSVNVGVAPSIAIWDNNSAIITRVITGVSTNDAACASLNSLTIDTAITAGTYTIDQNARVAEISTTLSNNGTPSDGAVMRWTSFNHTQNPTGSAHFGRAGAVQLAYAKNEAPATSAVRYPFLSNRHIFFVAYGDANTNAPADGDIVIVGNGKADPDANDSPNLNNDLNWATKETHVVTVDRHWDAALAYTGSYGGAVGDGAGARTDFSAYSANAGWISALITPGSQLLFGNSPNTHYRITIPGKIVVDSDASLAFGKAGAAIPASSFHDIYFDNVSPSVSTTLTANTDTGTIINVVSTAGFNVGDTIVLDDNNSVATTRAIAAIENSTQIRVTAALVAGYTTDQAAYIAKGPTTELPTGTDRRAGVFTMAGRTGRVNLYGQGADSFRTMKSDLAVDIEGDINTGYLGNNLTDAGNTWLDVKDNVVGNWQPLDNIAVAGGTNQLADNEFSSIRMAGTDDANQMPVWTGIFGAGGRNALPNPNMEVAEIGTIPMTNIYNADWNAGSPIFSSNYAIASAWTIFGNNANTEVNDAVYFGDQGNNMFYSLEFNIGTAMNANVNYVWEYWNGTTWASFTPRDAYRYEPRTGYTMPLSADTALNSLTISVPEGGTNFGLDQIVMIVDNDSPPIFRRLGTAAPTATTLTLTEPVPTGYTVAQNARVSRLNGGRWIAMDPTAIFTSGTGRRILSWTPSNLSGTPTKTTINGINAFWVRARIASFTSWTTSPTNQTTPVGMSGIERVSSGHITMSSGVQEAKITEITPGPNYNPNEQWILEYGNSPGWIQIVPVVPSAPYTWHIQNNILSQNTATTDFHIANGDLSWTNYTVTAKVRMRTVPDATSRKIGIVLRNSLDGNGYGALIEKTTTVQRIGLYPMALGTEGTVWVNSATKTFNQDVWYWIKADVAGTGASTVLRAKFWEVGTSEPGWDVTRTLSAGEGLWSMGRIGFFADAMIADFDDVTVSDGATFSDTFTDTGTWRVTGSLQGFIGTASPSVPFTSSYINFTIKHKGGRDGVVPPEIGDKIYLTSTAIRSYRGLDASVPITTSNANTKYEVWDFEWNPSANNYTVTGSASGPSGIATPGSTYTAPNNQISLRINSGAPTGTKFGSRMLLLQNNLLKNNGSWIGVNGMGSAVLIYPSYSLTGSPIATRRNIETQAGTATWRGRGTIDFWFKTNYNGAPSATISPHGMYLLDFANQGNTNRIFIRHSPDGFLEIGLFASSVQQPLLRQSFSANAGQWYHLRFGWDGTTNQKRAWLDGVPFEINFNSVVGTRAENSGIIRIGNRWTYDAAFDGSIDELAIFDEDIDTSSGCDWGSFTPPTSRWTDGQTAGCTTGKEAGVNLFRASFDTAMNPQEGFVWADYAFGNPAMIFTNGADTGNERFRIITYPQRTRVWVDNTGDKYTPSARIKHGSGFLEDAAIASLRGWTHNFYFHHKAKRDSATNPTYSPVLNLRRSTHIWSEEPFTYTGATMGAPINAGLGFGNVAVGLSGLATMNISHLSMANQYSNFSIVTNPFTSIIPYPSQTISKSVFYNFYERAYTVWGKTQGTNYVGAYFVTTHFAAGNIGTGYNAGASQNVGIDGSIFMGNRNSYVTVPPAAANGAAAFYSGRLYTVRNSEFYNNGITGAGTTGALNFGVGVAKVDISNNIFSINTNGIRLYGNSFFNLSDNVFDGHVADDVTTVGAHYGAGIRAAQSYTSIAIADIGSIFGRGLWNEADISLPPNTATFETESLLQFTGDRTQLLSPVLFGTIDYNNMQRVPEHYMLTTIPGVDIRASYSSHTKDIINFTTFGNMRTTGNGLTDTMVRTSGGYAWRLDPRSSDVTLDYTAKLVGVAGKPLAATGYIRLNSYYGTTDLPTVTLSGLGMTGPNLTWTAAATPDTWQQFVVSGTPQESALAELKISVKLVGVVEDSGTSEIIANATGNYLPALIEDVDKSWMPNQWVGYLFKDANGKIFEIVRNTDKLLYVKGTVVPHLRSTTLTATTPGDYVIFRQPSVYLDDVSVLSGTVDTGTLDFHSLGQPVSPWLTTGLTAEGVWGAQYSIFANTTGSFGQLLADALVARYANVSDPSPTTTEFNTNLTSSTDDFYNNGIIIFTEGSNKGIVRRVSDYGGANKTITVDPALPFAPANGDRFAILAATASSGGGGGGGGATAAEIWSYAFRTLTDATLNSGRLATAADVNSIRADIANVLTELGTGNISAIKTKTDTINWADVTGLVTTTGQIKAKTDTINWSEVAAIKTKTDTINWVDVTGIKLKTDTIVWGDITTIKADVATLISEIGTGNISAIKTKTDTINWNDVTGLITTSGLIKDKTDTINWNDIVGIKTKTDTINWNDVTGIKIKTDTIAWGDIANIQTSINALNNISAADVWTYATRTITGEVALTAESRKAIWDTACAILNSSGSVGKRVCDNLDAAISSRSTLTAAQVWAEATRTITGLENPALAAIANNIWSNASRTLTDYGNDITAQDVWNVLTSSLTTIDSIGKLLVTNVDETISSRSSQTSLDILSQNVATTSALVDVPLSSRASQSSLDAHESAQAAFRSSVTNTLGTMTINVAAILAQLSSIETKIDTISSILSTVEGKIDTIDTKLNSIKATVEDTNIKVAAIQTITNNILAKWGSYNAATIIGYIDTLEDNLGNPNDETSSATVFGKLNYIKNNIGSGSGGSGGSNGTIDLIYAQTQSTHAKLLEVQTELGFNGKSTTAYDEMIAVKGYVDSVEASLSTLDTRTSSIANSVINVSNDLKTITEKTGKVNVDSLTQLFEVKKTDIDYLKNKIIELKALTDINKQLLEKAVNQPIVKVVMEWGSIVIKFVIINPSDSTTQKIPFKAFLPKEVKQEYIIDLGGLTLNYDTTTEQYYVTADITLPPGESVIRSVKIKDIWVISEDEIASLRKQADELSNGLKNTPFFAQGLTLKTDINTRLDRVARKQKESKATPQDHILAYRENQEDMKAVQENIKGLKDLVLNSGAGSNFLASIGGIQTFATWGIVLVLIFGMGALGMFYYQLWKKKIVTVAVGKGKKTERIELPTPTPFQLPGLNFIWLKKILFGWLILLKDIFGVLGRLFKLMIPHAKEAANKISSLPKKTLIIFLTIGILTAIISGRIIVIKNSFKKNQTSVAGTSATVPSLTPPSSKEEKVKALVIEMMKEAAEKKKDNERVEKIIKKTEEELGLSASPSATPTPTLISEKTQVIIQVKDLTNTINVHEKPDKKAPVLAKIKAGKDYPFITEEGDWYQIELSDGKKGWVNKEFVKKVKIKETAKTEENGKILGAVSEHKQLLVIKQTPTDWLNVREKPSLGAKIVTKVYPGESYPFSEIKNGWYKILLKDLTEGWVSAQYAKPEKEMTDKTGDFVEITPLAGSGINIREKPEKESRVIKTVYIKNKYPKLNQNGDWIEIRFLDGSTGWVFKDFVRPATQ